MEPRFNEVAGDRPNLFVKWRVRYIEVLFHTFYCNFGRDIEIISFVILRTSLNRGSLNRGSTVLFINSVALVAAPLTCMLEKLTELVSFEHKNHKNMLSLTRKVLFANKFKPVTFYTYIRNIFLTTDAPGVYISLCMFLCHYAFYFHYMMQRIFPTSYRSALTQPF